MTRIQLRPFYTPEQLAQVYATPYDHTRWSAHVERVGHTIEVLDRFAVETYAQTVADLSAGDGAILNGSRHPWARKIVGDLTAETGPIEQAIEAMDIVDMFVCSETLEHVQDPDRLLRQIQRRAWTLLLTTPLDEPDSGNPEHYWAWGEDDLRSMLTAAGWKDLRYHPFTPESNDYYTFQVWECSS